MATPYCFMDDPANVIGTHQSLLLVPNGFPIGPLHLLLVPPDHREALQEADLGSALDFSQVFREYLVFHNMRGAGASRPEHLHFQALLRREAPLPLEVAPRKVLFGLEDTTVARVEDYPAYSLAVTGAHAPAVALAILQHLRPTPFNLVLSAGTVVVVPRTVEQPTGFSTRFGGLEMAGCVVVVEATEFWTLEYAKVWRALAECGWSQAAGQQFEEDLYGLVVLRAAHVGVR